MIDPGNVLLELLDPLLLNVQLMREVLDLFVVVDHLAASWEVLQGGEALDLDVFELVGGGVGLGDDDVGVILEM